eukprot:3308697-Pyramimonas_sp.AAC.1
MELSTSKVKAAAGKCEPPYVVCGRRAPALRALSTPNTPSVGNGTEQRNLFPTSPSPFRIGWPYALSSSSLRTA